MKRLLIFFTVLFISTVVFAQHSLVRIWETDSVLKTPESVLYDKNSKTLFVSNIGNFQEEKSGFISRINPDGKIRDRVWIPGLTAAKGMGLSRNMLYVAEQNTVAVVNVKSGKISKRILIAGAQMLNDITVDKRGTVYVSDTRKGIVYKIEAGEPSVYLEGLKSPNGLLSVEDNLYVLADGKLIRYDINRNPTVLAEGIEGGADGIEMVRENEFLVTGWEGLIYYVKADGSKQMLSDTRKEKINAADIGYDPVNQILYVPTFSKNKVVAYELK